MLKPSALYPGSFDPITRGHEDLIARASKIFDLSIGVAVNPDKSGTFSLQERVRLIQGVVSKYKIPAYRVVRIPGSTSRWMQRNGIEKIIRGKRDAIDEIAENQLDHFNRLENPNLSTHMFKTDENLRFASSSAAKMLVKANHNPSSIITMNVQEALTSRILSQYPIYITGGMGTGKSTISRSLMNELRNAGISAIHIELDTIAHDIYSSLNDPYYREIRSKLRNIFGNDISPDENMIDRKLLRNKLTGDNFAQLDAIIVPAIEFRYRDMIEGFKGVILIDGIVKEGLDLTRLAHNNVMMVDADLSTRINRIRERYVGNGDIVSDEYIQSMIDKQPTKECIKNMLDTSITQESNGSMQYVQNTHTPNTRAVLFKMLNQIDRYGEVRAIWILSKLGIQGNMSDHLNFLQSRYNEQHRYYHSWEHIVESLKWLFEIAIALNLDDSIIARIGGAILGHDLVYVVNELQYSTNESNSARVWGEYLKKYGASSEDLEIIDDLIKETRHGRVSIPEKLISHVMHDVDMAILGAQSSRYQQYARDIRQEFMPMKSGVEFEKLRFEAFLSKVGDAFKYKTNYFQDMIGSRVSGNTKWEVDEFSR